MRGFERLIGERRHVVAVNDVVRDSRMVRLERVQLFQNRARLQLVCVRFVRRQRGRRERQRPEDRRFAIVRIFRREIAHRFFVGDDAGALIELVGVDVQP